ncbi:M55 family metallopeptidase [Zhenpiania hominis]|uniref:M55 family metallopeptidase n=1 Tax=Zhenpiania hominis TaxID=2763644 RepID=UPI0039F5AB32
MKIFISADIEGVATTTLWPETEKGSEDYRQHAQQMTMEVIAACEAASEAGASEIVVRDAHEDGNNLDIWKLPENVTLIRGWSGHPYSMVYGIDPSFDAAIFIGYHSAASSEGNPLSHTESLNPLSVKLNGALASEFLLYSYAAALNQDLRSALPNLPQTYELEICYKKTSDAEKFSYFPGVQKRDDNTVVFSSRDYFEVLRVISFLC